MPDQLDQLVVKVLERDGGVRDVLRGEDGALERGGPEAALDRPAGSIALDVLRRPLARRGRGGGRASTRTRCASHTHNLERERERKCDI